MKFKALFISCEHAGNRIPPQYLAAFRGARAELESHKGWDLGALAIARGLARELDCPLLFTEVSRLLVDCNRSADNRAAFSKFSRALEREPIVEKYHHAYWQKARGYARGRGLHLSIHSFTPVFLGRRRKTDLGILFDPKRAREREFANALRMNLQAEFPRFRVHLNKPYRGDGDGLTTVLRRERRASEYLGVEMEINQKHTREARSLISGLKRALLKTEWT